MTTKKNTNGIVYVQGRAYNGVTSRVFEQFGYNVTPNYNEADIVVWTGGEDINPSIYFEKPLPGTYFSKDRDVDDIAMVDRALRDKKFLVGICRGAQLLNCYPNNGSLWQDVDGHESCHHTIIDEITKEKWQVNSVHHQQMIMGPDGELVAYTKLAKRKESYGQMWSYGDTKRNLDDPVTQLDDLDIEACWYPETRSLCMQFHMEFEPNGPTAFYGMSLMDRYFKAG